MRVGIRIASGLILPPPLPHRSMSTFFFRNIIALGLLLVALRPAIAADVDEWFEREVRPLLAERCLSCHSSALEAPRPT